MELRQYLVLLRKWAWLLVIGAMLAGGAAYYMSQSQPKVYQATATLLINQQADSTGAVTYSDLMTSQTLMKTYAEMIRTRPVLDEVQRRLGDGGSLGGISVQMVRDTQLMRVSVTHSDPVMAQKVVNLVCEVFAEQVTNLQLGQAGEAHKAIQDQLAAVQTDIGKTTAQIEAVRSAQDGRTDQQKNAEISALQSILSQYQYSYSNLLRTEQEMALNEARVANSVRVAEPAQDPGYLLPSKAAQNTLLAAMVGLMLAAGIAFLIEYLDDSVKSVEAVEAETGLTTLCFIARIPHKKEGDALVVARHPRSPLSEAYRTLRTNLQFAGIEKRLSPLLVTSANPSEGKTTTLANLGIAMAQAGRRVVMVDADLRRPSLHQLFGLPNKVGLTNLLVEDGIGNEESIQKTAIPNLWLIPSGPLPPNPSELLSSKRFGIVLSKLGERADIVLLDSPPLLAVADPAILANQAGSTLLVISWGKTRTSALKRAVQTLRSAGVTPIGVVANKLRGKAAGDYYYAKHYYAEPKASASKNGHKPAEAVQVGMGSRGDAEVRG